MPYANGTLHNCYRLEINGRLVGYFKTIEDADRFELWWKKQYPHMWQQTKIEPWFIEGEF